MVTAVRWGAIENKFVCEMMYILLIRDDINVKSECPYTVLPIEYY